MNLQNFWSRCFSLICLSGLVFQLQQVSELYFRYMTSSKIEYKEREVEDYQTVMFCSRYSDLLDRSRYLEFGISPAVPKNLQIYYQQLSVLSIKNILRLTPPVTDVIDDCFRRSDKYSVPLDLNRSECYNFFQIVKSVNGERICYTFRPKTQTNYSVGHVASSQTHINQVYVLTMLPSLAKSIVGYFVSYPSSYKKHEDPLNSRKFQARIINTQTFNQSKFAIHGDYTYITRLPPPYDTQCLQEHDREACYEVCLINQFKGINRIPWSGYHRDELDTKMLTITDLKNQTLASSIYASFEECHSLCKMKTECKTFFSRTTAHEYQDRTLLFNYETKKTTAFQIQASNPSSPHMYVNAVAFLNLIEYIIQVGSCFGVWFGMSIISFDPLKWTICHRKTSRVTPGNARRTKFSFHSRNRLTPVE